MHRIAACLLLALAASDLLAEPPPRPGIVRRHLVPASDLGQVLSFSEEMEYLPVATVDGLLRERHARALQAAADAEKAAREEASRLPVTHLARQASLAASVDPESGWCQAELTLELELLEDEEQSIPLLGGQAIAGAVLLDGAPARVTYETGEETGATSVQQNAMNQQLTQALDRMAQQQATTGAPRTLRALVKGKGVHKLQLRFATRVAEEEFYRVVRFKLPQIPAARLELTVPGKEISAAMQPPGHIEAKPGAAAGTRLLQALLPASADVAIRWVEVADAPDQPKEEVAPAGPARADATVLHLYDAGERGLMGQLLALVRVRRAPLAQLELSLPAGVQALSLAEPRQWTLEDPGPAAKARTARLLPPEKFQGDVTLRLEFTLSASSSGFDTELPGLVFAGLARQPGYLAVTRSANLELTCKPAKELQAISVADMPASLRGTLEEEEPLFLYRRTGPEQTVRLSGTRYPDAAVLAALVDHAQAWTLTDESGQTVGRIAYRFRSSGRETLRLDLAGHERTGIFIDGKTPTASDAGDGRVDVSLAGVKAGQAATLELRFRGKGEPLGASGAAVFRLPSIDVPVRELAWDVYTPSSHSFTDFRGMEGLRTGGGSHSNLIQPPDPAWPNAPARMRALGLAAGAHPTVKCLYLASPLSAYPLLMLLLFGGFLGYVVRLVLMDGRGFATAAAASALGVFLYVAYVPFYRGGMAAIVSGFAIYVAVVVLSAVGGVAARRFGAAAAVFALLMPASAMAGGDPSASGPGFLGKVFGVFRDRVRESEQAKQESYLRERLMRNRANLENERQQGAAGGKEAPQQQLELSDDADGYRANNAPMPASGEEVQDLAKSYVDKLTRMSPQERAKLKQSINRFVGGADAPQPGGGAGGMASGRLAATEDDANVAANKLGKKDIENTEALIIELSDEVAQLNAKMSQVQQRLPGASDRRLQKPDVNAVGGNLRLKMYVSYSGSPLAPTIAEAGFIRRSDLEQLRHTDANEEEDPESRLDLLECSIEASLQAGRARASVSLTFETTGSGWKETTLELAPATITGWSIDGAPADSRSLLERADGQATLRTTLTSRHVLKLDLAAPLTGSPQEGRLQLGRAPGCVTRCVIRGIDAGSEILASGASRLVEGAREIWLEPGSALQVGWRSRTVVPGLAVSAGDEQERVTAESFTVLSPENGVIGLRCRAQLTISDAGARTVTFRLPEGYELLDVLAAAGQPLGDAIPQTDGRIVVRLPERTRGALVFDILAERVAATGDGSVIEARAPSFPGAERESGFLAFVAEPGADIEAAEEKGVQGLDARELPGFAQPLASNAQVLMRAFQRPGYKLEAGIRRRSRVEVAQLESPGAEATTLVAGTGQALTSVTYRIRNTREQFLRLELPAGAQLESVLVAGRPVKPAQRAGPGAVGPSSKTGRAPGESGLDGSESHDAGGKPAEAPGKPLKLVPLSPSKKTRQGLSEVPVTIVYSTPSGRMERWGGWKSSLPRVSVAIQEMTWTVYLPEGYRFFRSGGEFREGGDTSGYSSAPQREYLAMKAEAVERKAQAARPAYRRGLFGLAAPIPATSNGKQFRVKLLKADAAAPALQLFYAEGDLDDAVSGVIFYLGLLVLPLGVLGAGRGFRFAAAVFALAGAALAMIGAEYVGTSGEPLAAGLASGFALLVAYWLLGPVRRWRQAAAAAAVLFLAVTQVQAAPPLVLVPYGKEELPKALETRDWKTLMPAELGRKAEELSKGSTTEATPEAPLVHVIAAAFLDGQVAGDSATFVLSAAVDVLRDGPQVVQLLEGEFAVAAFEGDGALSLQGADDYIQQEIGQGDAILAGLSKGREKIPVLAARMQASVVLEGKRRHSCRLEVVLRKPFALKLPPIGACKARVTFDREGVDADIAGGLKESVESRDGRTVLTADLSSGGDFSVSGYEAAPADEDSAPEIEEAAAAPGEAPPPPPRPEPPSAPKPHLSASVRTDLSIGESLVKGFAIVDVQVRRARAPLLELAIPEGMRLNRIQGPEGRDVPVPRLPKAENGFQSLKLAVPPGFRKSLQVTLHFERPLAEGESVFAAPIVETRGTEFESGYLTLQRDGHVEVKTDKAEGIEEIAPDRLPFATTPATSMAFRYSDRGARLRLSAKRHEEARLSSVAVDSMNVKAEFTDTGSVATTVDLEVRRSSGQYLRLLLPAGASLQRVMRDGNQVDASNEKDGSLLLPLDTSRGPGSEPSRFSLEYRGPDVTIGRVGELQYKLPACDLPVTGSGLTWSLQPPEGWRFYVEGYAESDFLGMTGRSHCGSGSAYLSGPAAAATLSVKYLSAAPAFVVEGAHLLFAALAGLAIIGAIDAALPCGAALSVISLALSIAMLGFLQGQYPASFPSFLTLAGGMLLGLGLSLLWRARSLWRRYRAPAATALLLLVSVLPVVAQEPAADFLYLPSDEAARSLSAGEWLLLPATRVEAALRALEEHQNLKQPEDLSAPFDSLPQSASIAVEVAADDARVTARYRWVLLAGEVQEAVLGAPGALESAKVDGKTADLTAGEDGKLSAWLRGKGPHEVELVFRIPVTRLKEAGWLEWELPRTPITRVDIALPGTGRGVEVVPSLSTTVREDGALTRASAVVRMSGNLFVRWFEKAEQASTAPKERQQARFEADSATGYRIEGSSITGRTGLTYTITQGALAGLSASVPAGAEVLEVAGESVKSWKQTPDGGLEIAFDRFRESGSILWIDHVTRMSGADVTLGTPLAKGAAAQTTLLSARGDDSAELRALDAGGLRPIDPEELPSWLQGEGIPLAFRGEAPASSVKLRVERRKAAETPAFDIPRMQVNVLPGLEGWIETRLELSVRNNARQHLKIALPEGAAPIDCKVQGEPRKPGKVSGALLVPLVRSTGRPDRLEPFTLELTYLSKAGPPEGALARWPVPLPRVEDFAVGRLEIAVTLPRNRALSPWSAGLSAPERAKPGERFAQTVEGVAAIANPLNWLGMRYSTRSVSRSSESAPVAGAPMPQKAQAFEQRARYSAKKRARAVAKDMRDMEEDVSSERAESGIGAADESMPEPAAAAPPPPPPPPPPASPKPMEAPGVDGPGSDGGYEALQRSLGDRGALPVGILNKVGGLASLRLEGALYPAGGTPSEVVLLVYDPSAKQLLDLALGLAAFLLSVVTLGWAVRRSWLMPFFLVASLLPMLGYALEWHAGTGTVGWILAGLALGFLGAATRLGAGCSRGSSTRSSQ